MQHIFRRFCLLYPCKNCELKYIGEISWNLPVRLKEHRRDIRIGNLNNALFQHISQSNHNFDFNSAKMLLYIHNKRFRRIFEAGAISLCNSVNTRPGFYNISPYFSKSILDSYNIFHCRDRPTNPCRDLPINLKHIKLHARVRTIISEYDRNWLSPFFLANDLDI